ncbi:MAG: hypothetical protein AAFY88_04300 [Acidobacteriota bacterium]
MQRTVGEGGGEVRMGLGGEQDAAEAFERGEELRRRRRRRVNVEGVDREVETPREVVERPVDGG